MEHENLDDHVGIVELCGGHTPEGEAFYVYISLLPSRYEDYRRAHELRETIDLHQYGKVLHAGWGEEPPEDVKEQMEKEYKVNHNFEEELKIEVEKIAKEQR